MLLLHPCGIRPALILLIPTNVDRTSLIEARLPRRDLR
jgi:hypothetical protein